MSPAASDQTIDAERKGSEPPRNEPISDSLGWRIRSRRQAQKLSLTELARLSGISKGYLSQIERSRAARPSAATVFAIADSLGVSIDALFEGAEPQEQRVVEPQVASALREFAEEADLPPADIEMLAGIHYRGDQPRDKDDWRFLYESIRRSVGASRRSG